jgi:hypothetical protein
VPDPLPPGVETSTSDLVASATCLVDAEPAAVFTYVRQPANHPAINGDGSVRGARFGPDEPALGDRFGMRMKALGLPYRTTSKVVELEEGRRIAWRLTGGHIWRWDVEPEGAGTRVTETFDISTAGARGVFRLMRVARHHESNLARSVAKVRDHFASG